MMTALLGWELTHAGVGRSDSSEFRDRLDNQVYGQDASG